METSETKQIVNESSPFLNSTINVQKNIITSRKKIQSPEVVPKILSNFADDDDVIFVEGEVPKIVSTVADNCEPIFVKETRISASQASRLLVPRNRVFDLSNFSLTNYQIQRVLVHGAWLNNDHIDKFHSLLLNSSSFRPQPSHWLQCSYRIQPVPYDQKHIQLLFSINHWVCAYYDTSSIYIYDSLNKNKLENSHKIYLSKLFPDYENNGIQIHFPKVQHQRNGTDCGVFAIAFATTIYFNKKPEDIHYDQSRMRPHLAEIFKSSIITPFPITENNLIQNISRANNDINNENYEPPRKKILLSSKTTRYTNMLEQDIKGFS